MYLLNKWLFKQHAHWWFAFEKNNTMYLLDWYALCSVNDACNAMVNCSIFNDIWLNPGAFTENQGSCHRMRDETVLQVHHTRVSYTVLWVSVLVVTNEWNSWKLIAISRKRADIWTVMSCIDSAITPWQFMTTYWVVKAVVAIIWWNVLHEIR